MFLISNAQNKIVVKTETKTVIVKTETETVVVKPITNEVKVLQNGSYVFNMGGESNLFYIAGESLPLNSPVILNEQERLEIAKASNLNHSDRFLGINLFSTPINLVATIKSEGIIENDSWEWELNKPIFLGINGDLTQTVDNGITFLLQIAKPITNKSILIIQNTPIFF